MYITTLPFSQIGSSGNEEEWLDSVYIWKVVSIEFPNRLDVGDEWEESNVSLRLLVNSWRWSYHQWRWWRLCIEQIWGKRSGVGFECVGATVSVRHSSGGRGSVGGTQAKAGSQEWAGHANWDGFWSLMAQMVKNLAAMQETQVWSLGQEDPLEKGRVTHSSILAWIIPWTEEPGGPQSMGLQRVRHDSDWATNTLIKLS